MRAKIRVRSAMGLIYALIILLIAACNTAGGSEPSVGNVTAAVELAEKSTEDGGSEMPENTDSIEQGTREAVAEKETLENDTAITGNHDENLENDDSDETTPTAEPPQEVEPTSSPPTPTSIVEPLIEGEGLPQDDRPEYLRLATADWNTNWEKHSIDYEEFISGGPPRDGIRSIDAPDFVSNEEAGVWLAGNEPVIILEINGDARAYPLQILIWHEIVNDTVGDIPVIVTFCPLCNSALVFDRRLDGETYEFGTSGLLRNSDLVMYDRTTESLWQQFTGEGIVGDLNGEQLTFLPSAIVSFADFRAGFPEGLVLSNETGFDRAYGINPYAGFDTYENPLTQGGNIALLKIEEDRRLPAAERVVTLSIAESETDVAYPLSVLSEAVVINDQQGGQNIAVFFSPGTSSALGAQLIAIAEDVGATGVFNPELDHQTLTFSNKDGVIIDDQTSSTWNILGQSTAGPLAGETLEPIVHGDHFWFSWAAFKPDTIIYRE